MSFNFKRPTEFTTLFIDSRVNERRLLHCPNDKKHVLLLLAYTFRQFREWASE